MKKIFYEKIGRRYVPVSEYNSDLLYAMPEGTHIIMSYPGGKSTRYNIDPALAPMIAAGRVAEDAMSQAIMKASELRPNRKPITDEQKEVWDNLVKVFGEERYYIELASAREIAEAGVKAMQEEALKLMTNPSVKLAYEHFLLVAELTKDEEHELKS